MFQCNVESTSVTRNGSCVTMIANTSAGSSGARRRHFPPDDLFGRTVDSGSAGGASVVMSPSTRLPAVSAAGGLLVADVGVRRTVDGPRGRSRTKPDTAPGGRSLALVLVARGLGQLLPVVQRRPDVAVTGDRRADVLGHLRRHVGELRDRDVLHADRRPGLHARVGRVGTLDRL